MSDLSNYLQYAALNYLNGTAMPTAPASLFVALFNVDPTDIGTGGSEVTTTIRTADHVAATFGAITGNTSMANSAIVDFGAAVAGAAVTHFGLFTAATGCNLLASDALAAPQTVAVSKPISFAVGALSVSVT